MTKQELDKVRVWYHCSKDALRHWWHFGNNCFHIELSKPKLYMSFGASSDGEHVLSGSFMGLYWHLECWALAKRLPKCSNSFRFYWHDGGFWFSFWGNDWESSSTDPWWREMYHLDLTNLLLGQSEYSNETVEIIENVVIPMPEANFNATVTFELCTWKRPRWFAVVKKYSTIHIDKNAPKFPGKGENSWDQGDDSIYQMSVSGHSLPKAIAGYVEAVLGYREKRNGRRSLLRVGE